MDAGRLEGRALDDVTQREARVADLTRRLQQAERAVGRANSAEAADMAHRRAEALLLELEAAEHDLTAATRPLAPLPVTASLPRRRGMNVTSTQESLFDVG